MAASIKNAGMIGLVQVTLPGCTPRIAADLDDAARMVQEATAEAIRATNLRLQRSQIALETREVTEDSLPKVNDADFMRPPRTIQRPTLAEAQRQAIIRNIRQSWATPESPVISIVNDDPIFEQEQPVQQQDLPSFDRPRRLISLEDE